MSCISGGLKNAQAFVHRVINAGQTVTLERPGTKDAGGMVMSPVTLDVKAYPIEFAPFQRTVKEIVGWSDDVDVVFTIEAKGQTISAIKQYQNAIFNKRTYKISFVENDSAFADTFLHIIIGAKR